MNFVPISRNGNFQTIKTTSSELAMHVNKWKGQRPVDEKRVYEIMDDIKNKQRVQPVICLAQWKQG